MIDIFTALLGTMTVCALLGATVRTLLAPPKVWDEDYDEYEEIEDPLNYKELREQNPHIWMD